MSGTMQTYYFRELFSSETEFKRFRNIEEANRVAVIDVDSESFEDAVFDDVPETRRNRRHSPENLRRSNQTFVDVINIDDDDDDEEEEEENAGSSTGTNRREESSTSGKNSAHAPDEEAQYNNRKGTPVRLFKCKRTYSGNANLSDYDYCELVEDSSGMVQELWRKVLFKRTGLDNSFSDLQNNNHTEPPVQDNVENHRGSGKHPASSNMDFDGQKNTNAEAFPLEINSSLDAVEDITTAATACSVGRDEKDETIPSECDDASSSCEQQGFIIPFDREKFKESEEFRKSMEQEMASRKLALEAQAAEAKLLRMMVKRRKAESLRLLDMERRQKERLEDIRNTQKKEEEILEQREKIRTEVVKELRELESGCRNMASLLHSLRIPVAGWPYPSPQQVKTSYRKALIAFHPDRASRSDIRRQVEAEEKFKLIRSLEQKNMAALI